MRGLDQIRAVDLPQVSVIIPIYNGAADVPDLFDCLAAQQYPGDRWDVCCIDNNSQDATAALLRQQIQSLPIPCQLLQETQIQSSYAARNRGIRATTGEILAFTDADCRPQPTWLMQLVQPFEDTAVDLVAGHLQALPSPAWLERYAARRGILTQETTLAHPTRPYGQTANLAVRRSLFSQIGLFRPYLTTGGDADLCWRSQQSQPRRLVAAPQAVVYHRHRATLRDLWQQWHRYGQGNQYLHQLYGAPLMPDWTGWDWERRLGRWSLKQLPATLISAAQGQAPWGSLLDEPLDWYCALARQQGQRSARLTDAMRQIDKL